MNIFHCPESAVNALFSIPLNLRKLLTASHFLMSSQIKVGLSPSKKNILFASMKVF